MLISPAFQRAECRPKLIMMVHLFPRVHLIKGKSCRTLRHAPIFLISYIKQKTKKGYVVKYIGTIDDNYKDASAVKTKYVENAVDALLNGKEVEQTETKAIGCTIKV